MVSGPAGVSEFLLEVRHLRKHFPAAGGLWARRAGTVKALDLFGNPLPPGTVIDARIHYVVCSGGIAPLLAAMPPR